LSLIRSGSSGIKPKLGGIGWNLPEGASLMKWVSAPIIVVCGN
jgi:hypothetical protein